MDEADCLYCREAHLTTHQPVTLRDIRPVHLHFRTGVDTMQSMWPTRGENPALSVMSKQRSKTSSTGSRAIQLAGSAVEGSLGFALIWFVLSSFPAMASSLSRY